MKEDSEPIASFGEVFDDMIFEMITDPYDATGFIFEYWEGKKRRKGSVTDEVWHDDKRFVPFRAKSGLVRAVRFPPKSQAFGSMEELASSVRQIFSSYAYLTPEVASILAAFSFATWVVDCLPGAPILYFVGPRETSDMVLRLLACTCARAVLLSGVDVSGLATIPAGLRVTMLLAERYISRAVVRVLGTAQNPHFHSVRGNKTLNLYGAKVFVTDSAGADGRGLELCIPPPRKPVPMLTNVEAEKIAAETQPKMLGYRIQNYQRVRQAQIDCEKFLPLSSQEIYAWLAPILGCKDLQSVVTKYLLEMTKEAAALRYTNLECVVAEAVLTFTHESEMKGFFVGDAAERVRDILKGRHEDTEVTDKTAGSVLRGFGIRPERITEGYWIELTDAVRQQIHTIAEARNVLAIQDGVPRCPYCRKPEEKDQLAEAGAKQL